jgi:hypothetical protein
MGHLVNGMPTGRLAHSRRRARLCVTLACKYAPEKTHLSLARFSTIGSSPAESYRSTASSQFLA